MRMHLRLLLALLVAYAVVGAGCSSTSTSPAPASTGHSSGSGSDSPSTSVPAPSPAITGPVTGRITVSAAASLTAPFKTIAADFTRANPGADVAFNFDSSSTLAKQIQDGAPADGFASADEANMTKLTDANLLVGSPTVFARNQLTIVVKKGNPKAINSLADLASVDTVSLCGADVPCGTYAEQVLRTANVAIPTEKVTRGQNVKATLTAVADGDADAGIVYVTDVTGDKVQAVAIPDAQNAIATYPIGVVRASATPSTVQAFIAYLLSAAGQATLRAAGFLPPL